MAPNLRLQIIFFSLVRITFNTMHRMVYPFLGEFSRGMGVGLVEISQAFTLRSIAAGLSPLLAFLADSRGRKTGMVIGLALIIVGASAVVFWPTYQAFVLAVIISTVGYQIFVPSMQAYLGDQVPYRQRGLALAVTEFGWSLSFILGVPLAGLLITRAGWASPYPWFLALALVGLLVLLRLVPNTRSVHALNQGVTHSLRVIFTSPVAWAGLALSVSMTAANEVVNLVFGLYMDTAFGMRIAALGVVAVGIGLAEFGGEALVGGLVDRLGKLRSVTLGLLLNSGAALAFVLVGGGQAGAILALFAFYLTFEFAIVSSLPLMTELLPAARASLMALNFAMFALGRALGATLAARLFTLELVSLPGIAPNALAAIFFNFLALLALFFLRRWWHDGAAQV